MQFKIFISFLLSFLSYRALAIVALVSHNIFYLPDSLNEKKLTPYIELSWQITPHTIHFTRNEEKKIVAKLKVDIVYSNNSGIVAEEHNIFQTIPRTDISEIANHKIVDLHRNYIPAGALKLKLQLTDQNDTTNKFIFEDSLIIKKSPNETFYSKPQLLDTLFQKDKEGQTIFTKNDMEQIPSSTNFLDNNKNILMYYVELYHTEANPKESFPLIQKVFVSKTELGTALLNMQNTDTIYKPEDIIPVYGSINIEFLRSGNYYLTVILEDRKKRQVATESLFLQRLNTSPIKVDTALANAADSSMEKVNVLNLNKTFIAKFTIEQVRAILKMLLPVSDPMGTKTINGFLERPDELYMRYYIYNFFVAINQKDPEKAWKEYSQKVLEVNKLFKGQSAPGYETTRGFYYLKYGAPTEILTRENEQGVLPYEVWQYTSLTQTNGRTIPDAKLLFYKPNQAYSDWVLLHSTVLGEAQNMNWRSYLYTKENSNMMNSLVEDYFPQGR